MSEKEPFGLLSVAPFVNKKVLPFDSCWVSPVKYMGRVRAIPRG